MLRKILQMIVKFYYFLRDFVKNRGIIYELTKNDFKSRYFGPFLGLFWAFAQPTITLLIFWFVFAVGFRSAPVGDFPFILWLVAGMIPWFFLNDSIATATTSITGKSYLVKKIPFRVGILPIIKILSSLAIHLFFIVFMFLMFALYGNTPHLHNIQVLYYLFAALVLVSGISWITSSLVVFLKDIRPMVSILLQFCFWLTPIFWNIDIMPERYRSLIKLNPFFYIIQGYRDSLIHKVWFWEHFSQAIYFWMVTGTIFAIGALLFRRLKPHFADVL